MGDRCTGECCERFNLTGVGRTVEEILTFLRYRALDGAFIADMVVPLYPLVPGAEAPNGEIVVKEPEGGGWVFTCRHFDAASRSCMAYAARPRMCRDYPYGHPCEHKDRCGWDAGRAGAHPSPAVYHADVAEARRVHLRVVRAGVAPALSAKGGE